MPMRKNFAAFLCLALAAGAWPAGAWAQIRIETGPPMEAAPFSALILPTALPEAAPAFPALSLSLPVKTSPTPDLLISIGRAQAIRPGRWGALPRVGARPAAKRLKVARAIVAEVAKTGSPGVLASLGAENALRRAFDVGGSVLPVDAVGAAAQDGREGKAEPQRPKGVFVPAKELRVPWISIRRAWRHSFYNWNGETVLKVPLTATDHAVLIGLSYLPAVILSAGFGVLDSITGGILFGLEFCLLGAVLALNHVVEWKDGHSVARNARRYAAGAGRFDKDLLHVAEKFESELRMGWEVAWTDSPNVLAKVEARSRRVVLTLGWIVESPDIKDRRRLAYLTDTLRRVRHAVEEANFQACLRPRRTTGGSGLNANASLSGGGIGVLGRLRHSAVGRWLDRRYAQFKINLRDRRRLDEARKTIVSGSGASVASKLRAVALIQEYVLKHPYSPETRRLLFNTKWAEKMGKTFPSPNLTKTFEALIGPRYTVASARLQHHLWRLSGVVFGFDFLFNWRVWGPLWGCIMTAISCGFLIWTVVSMVKDYPQSVKDYNARYNGTYWPRRQKAALADYHRLHEDQLYLQDQDWTLREKLENADAALSVSDTPEVGMIKLLHNSSEEVRAQAYVVAIETIAYGILSGEGKQLLDWVDRLQDPAQRFAMLLQSLPADQWPKAEADLATKLQQEDHFGTDTLDENFWDRFRAVVEPYHDLLNLQANAAGEDPAPDVSEVSAEDSIAQEESAADAASRRRQQEGGR